METELLAAVLFCLACVMVMAWLWGRDRRREREWQRQEEEFRRIVYQEPAVQSVMDAEAGLADLIDEYERECKRLHLPKGCAEELLADPHLTALQRNYLEHFARRWDAILEGERLSDLDRFHDIRVNGLFVCKVWARSGVEAVEWFRNNTPLGPVKPGDFVTAR